jgi:colanic acid/amylovoran biosynthesis glycosyltransferase
METRPSGVTQPKDLRIAYLTSQYPATSHTFIRREVAALRRRGIAIDTFSVRPPGLSDVVGPQDREEANRTYTLLAQSPLQFLRSHVWALFSRPRRYFVTAYRALKHRAPGLRNMALSMAHFAESILLANELHRRRITHLHNHFANSAATVGLLASRFLECRWSFVIHGPSETDYPAGYLLKEKITAADFVACAHYFGASQGMRLVPYDQWSKFHVVRCGIEFKTLPTDVSQRHPRTIVCVGRLSYDKAQAGLLEAFSKVHERFSDARLKFVGGGADRHQLESLTKTLGLSDRVTFLGPLPETETLQEIASSGMLVLPSFWEGLTVVLMEALALEVPAITSRIAGVPELIVDGSNGLLFTPANWSELSQCMIELLSSPELGIKLSKKGRLSVQSEFDVDRAAAKLAELFAHGISATVS